MAHHGKVSLRGGAHRPGAACAKEQGKKHLKKITQVDGERSRGKITSPLVFCVIVVVFGTGD